MCAVDVVSLEIVPTDDGASLCLLPRWYGYGYGYGASAGAWVRACGFESSGVATWKDDDGTDCVCNNYPVYNYLRS